MIEWKGRKRYMPRDLDRITVNIRRLRRADLPRVQSISRQELRRIKLYTLAFDPDTWQRIAHRRGVLSYALLLHEQAEVDYFRRSGIDPMRDVDDWNALYNEAHAHALHVEHRFLQKVAERQGYRGLNLGTLVASNLSVDPESRREDVSIIRLYWPPKEAQVIQSLLDVALAFYKELLEEWE